MAGDWMQVEKATPDKPEVIQIARMLGIGQGESFLGCFRVWTWFDSHTVDGNAPGVTTSDVDCNAHVPGLADAMAKTTPKPWLIVNDGGVQLPDFDKHNGVTAKKRGLTRNRVTKHRNAPSVTTALPEKRREYKKKSTSSSAKSRERDPIWDTVEELYFGGHIVEGQEKVCGKLVAFLKKKQATPDELRARRQRLVDAWGPEKDTVHSIQKHWDKFDGKGPQQNRPGRAAAPPGKYDHLKPKV